MGTDPVSVERVSALAAVPEGFFAGVGGGEETWIGALFEADFFFFKKKLFWGLCGFLSSFCYFPPFFLFLLSRGKAVSLRFPVFRGER